MKPSESALHRYNDLMQNESLSEDIKQRITLLFADMLRAKRAVRDRVSIQSIQAGEV